MIFRRRRSDGDQDPEELEGQDAVDELDDPDAFDDLAVARPNGPWDRAETDADSSEGEYIDLGGLVIRGIEGVEVRLHVEDQAGTVAAALLVTPEAALELRAFAAPRSEGIWADVRADIVAEAERHGGKVDEIDGEFGVELHVEVPVSTQTGQQGLQISRVVGVDGPRWLLRGNFLGKAAVEPDPDGPLEQAFRNVIVNRGDEPMAPRDPITMHMPVEAQAQIEAAAQAALEQDVDGDDE